MSIASIDIRLGSRHKGTMMERFIRYVMPVTESGCHLWTGATSRGYGVIANDDMRLVKAHRVAYENAYGSIPDGLHIDHLCRVRSCVNPIHLEAVTQKENTLRGEGVTAENARKVGCSRGHLYEGDNLYVYPNGDRMCRACHNASKDSRKLAQLRG